LEDLPATPAIDGDTRLWMGRELISIAMLAPDKRFVQRQSKGRANSGKLKYSFKYNAI
jgi:hypothetical protein